LYKSQVLVRTCAGQAVAAGERGSGSPYFAARGQVLQEIKEAQKLKLKTNIYTGQTVVAGVLW
jgi:hypothetical protein